MDNITEPQAVPAPGIPKAKIITGIILAFLFPLILSALIAGSSLTYEHKVYYSRFIFWTEVGLLWLYARFVEKQNLLIWTEKESGFKFLLKSILILYAVGFLAQIVSAIPTLLGFKESNAVMKQIAATVKGHPILIVFISFTAGFCEEMIFRAYVFTRLSLLIKNKYIPIIISAGMFALLHYKYNSPREYIFSFLIGVIMAVHYQRYGNIKPLIIVHFLIDVVGLVLAAQYLK
ncbi:type II CAAX endopeptidase family protein [Mucilaginibacter sp. dw_454]|uniref:CPBP family intramembrane glutamic endopeptidase n=1 Tax=Mucilaginibacter sp. dw_454 TaxID=2720079 RepID=UPI001BD48A6C|nr:type II CAAX endopeptidase family protein [Mucilaginibacter sp. dw_454]